MCSLLKAKCSTVNVEHLHKKVNALYSISKCVRCGCSCLFCFDVIKEMHLFYKISRPLDIVMQNHKLFDIFFRQTLLLTIDGLRGKFSFSLVYFPFLRDSSKKNISNVLNMSPCSPYKWRRPTLKRIFSNSITYFFIRYYYVYRTKFLPAIS